MLPKPPLVIALMLLLAAQSGTAAALGLGGMRTQSALNQPFYAEIELSDVKPDEIDAIKARLATSEEFADAGAERPHFLTRLQFSPAIGTDGRPYIQVSSREPVREPYIDFLVEVVWPQGTLVKQYTVLLDPPARSSAPPPRLVPPTTTARRRPPPAPEQAPEPAPAPRSTAPPPPQQAAPAPLPRPAPAPVPPQARDTRFPLYYGPVPRGATLTRIAREMTPPGATVEQTAMALFRNNQNAFMRGSINRLSVGVDLVVPTAEELFALDAAAARRQFQDALAGRSVNTSPITDVASDARLSIGAAGGGQPLPPGAEVPPIAAADPGLRDDLLDVQAATESTRQETTELRDRILELESQLADIQRLLALRNEQLAGLQADESDPSALPIPPAPGEPAVALLPPVGESADAGVVQPPETSDRPPPEPIVEPGIGTVQPDGSVAELPTAEPPTATAAAAAEVGADAQVGVPAAGKPFWAGAVERVSGAAAALPPWGLGIVGAALLGGLGFLVYRRRRLAAGEEAMDWVATPGGPMSEPLPDAGSQGGFELASTAANDLGLDVDTLPDLDSDAPLQPKQAVSAGPVIDVQTGLPISVITNLPQSQQETQEPDVIAEADIYILYGRYREAEGLLREELERAPNRRELKFKLGEALLGSGNRAALAELLAQMKAAGDDAYDPAKWASLQTGVAGLGSDGEAAPAPAPARRVRALDKAPTHIASDQALEGDGLRSTDVPGDSEDTDLGFSVREVTPSSANRLREQMADLELDLQEMDDLGVAMASTSTEGARRPGIYTEDLSAFEPTEPTESTESPAAPAPRPGRADRLDLDLDLDLDGLDELAAAPLEDDLPDLTIPVDAVEPPADPPAARGPWLGEPGGLPDPLETLALSPGIEDEQEALAGSGPVEDSISSDVLSSQWRMDSGLWDEAATKMDLARAYMEMDDADAARAILEEVLQEGSDAQRADATSLLARLG
jgi:pilus assembly protein FimV